MNETDSLADGTKRCGTYGCDGEAVAVYKWTNLVTGEGDEMAQCEDCEPNELEPLRRLDTELEEAETEVLK